MKYLNDIGIYLKNYNFGNQKTFCPRCKNSRKPHNQSDTPLSVTIEQDRTLYKCHNCDWTGAISENKNFNTLPKKMDSNKL